MSRETNAEKVIRAFQNADYYIFTKGDKLRLNSQNEILDNGTMIGYIKEEFDDRLDCYSQIVVLTNQNFKSQKSWKTHKKQLAKAANDFGYKVIFVPVLDIGFGADEVSANYLLTDHYQELIEVAKYSQDEDIKTAAMLVCRDDEIDRIVAYSYNQEVDEEIMHAERVLCDYINMIDPDIDKEYYVLSLLEPCAGCLENMICHGVYKVNWSEPHKAKWNNDSYIELTNDIGARVIMSMKGRPIKYDRLESKLVTKFYHKGEVK